MLEHEGVSIQNLSFAFADLTKADGWDKAMEGIDKAVHVASPLGGNNHENPELIPIAESGVKNVFSAAISAGKLFAEKVWGITMILQRQSVFLVGHLALQGKLCLIQQRI